MHRGAVPVLVLCSVLAGGAVFGQGSWPEAGQGDSRTALTVVPPGPIGDMGRVEARVAVRNTESIGRVFRVRLYMDHVGPEWLLAEDTVSIPAGGIRLVRAWWEARGRPGAHSVLGVVERGGRAVARLQWPFSVLPSHTRALPFLQGVWLDPLGLSTGVYARSREVTQTDVCGMVDAMHRLGMAVIIITYVEYDGWVFYPTRLELSGGVQPRRQMLPFDVVGTVLAQAERRGMHVMLGLGRGGDMELLWGGTEDRARLRAGIGKSARVAGELWRLYGHHRSLYGWYLTHEANDLAAAAAYYDPVADFCHALCPDKPVMVAPAGTPLADRDTLARSHVDIFAYQDAVGAGYCPGVYTYDPERRLSALDGVYGAYRRWHEGSGKHLWADLEVWEMAGPRYERAYPASPTRVLRQIALEAPHVEMLTAYEYSGFLEAPDSEVKLDDRRAVQLYVDYSTYVSQHGADIAPAGPELSPVP